MAIYWLEALSMLGRWRELDAVAHDVRDLTDHPGVTGALAPAIGVAMIRQDRLDEARPHIELARHHLQRISWSDAADQLVVPVAMFDIAEGRLHEAVQLIDHQLHQPEAFPEGVALLVAVGIGALADHVATPSAARRRALSWSGQPHGWRISSASTTANVRRSTRKPTPAGPAPSTVG